MSCNSVLTRDGPPDQAPPLHTQTVQLARTSSARGRAAALALDAEAAALDRQTAAYSRELQAVRAEMATVQLVGDERRQSQKKEEDRQEDRQLQKALGKAKHGKKLTAKQKRLLAQHQPEPEPPSGLPSVSTEPDQDQEQQQPIATLRTGLVFDEAMSSHRCEGSKHMECPQRLIVIRSALEGARLVSRCLRVPCREATKEEICAVHSLQHVDDVDKIVGLETQGEIDAECNERYNSVYMNSSSRRCASLAAGSAVALVKEVVSGAVENGIACVRPPGHHAEADQCCGFCVFNNVAIAAAAARQQMGVQRVLIVDWDVHHGNGTQKAFYEDGNVLYFSIHRYDDAAFFPCSKEAGPDHCGRGAGHGANVNVGWNVPLSDSSGGMGDAEYLAAFRSVLLPLAREFAPELILVSAGYDAAKGERYGCSVTPPTFGLMTRLLRGVCPSVVLILEGGYSLPVLGRCVAACTAELLRPRAGGGGSDDGGSDEGVGAMDGRDDDAVLHETIGRLGQPKQSALLDIASTIRQLRGLWRCFAVDRADAALTFGGTPAKPGGTQQQRSAKIGKTGTKKEATVTGYGIAVRNTALSKWKSDIRKLQRKESQLREQAAMVSHWKSEDRKKLSKQEQRLLASEEETLEELDIVIYRLKELEQLSKADAVRYYASSGPPGLSE